MTLTVLVTTGLLVCAFYLYVLYQRTRDAKGPSATRHSIGTQTDATPKPKQPFIMRPGKIGERIPSDVTSHRAPRLAKLPRDREAGWNASERIAYQRIASSLILRKRC